MTGTRRLCTAAATVLAATGLAIGATASPASAATDTVTLGFSQCDSAALIGLLITGHADSANPIGFLSVDVWGSDSFFDDHLFGPYVDPHAFIAGADFSITLCLPGSVLDEDDGTDEVYVKASVGGNHRSLTLRSNQVRGHF